MGQHDAAATHSLPRDDLNDLLACSVDPDDTLRASPMGYRSEKHDTEALQVLDNQIHELASKVDAFKSERDLLTRMIAGSTVGQFWFLGMTFELDSLIRHQMPVSGAGSDQEKANDVAQNETEYLQCVSRTLCAI